MNAVKKESIIINYPDFYECACGSKAPLTYQDITTMFNNKKITVEHVPVYICLENHVKLARLTQVKLRNKLKEAYSQDKDRIRF
ncbi:hypothetical protein J41TS12_03870 [Paenibacillus antibioticophila]|uniref:Uncharacterized protein n=1 Tax=Paenibacillus antibioticophila TaxID=1274374 RepID=A0A919XM45_9BACL|nr:hypothetical protein [Paenibacillus antibioticophila]GIO35526.1 hypothetical protein J41TS12_03870 [Paenibacillus antibioticophila]